jgi:hypothetical protein
MGCMELKAGMRLRSAVCTTEVIVVKGSGEVDVRCGGEAMIAMGGAQIEGASIPEGDGTLLGKRYADDNIELLCTKPGPGSLAIGDEPLHVKGAKPLPSSD